MLCRVKWFGAGWPSMRGSSNGQSKKSTGRIASKSAPRVKSEARENVSHSGSWCYACSVEHNMLNKLSNRGVKIVGLNYKDQVEDAMLWLENLGDPFKYCLDFLCLRICLRIEY